MKRFAEICILAVLGGSVTMGQEDTVPARWIGDWSLDLRGSQLGEFWAPGGPGGVAAMSQSLEIAAISERVKITTHTYTSLTGPAAREVSREEFEFNLDGRETVSPAGANLSFKRIDDWTFDIVVSGSDKKLGSWLVEKHFVFSGGKLTMTEARRWLDVAGGGDQAKGAVVRTSTSVLVFGRVLSTPHARQVWHFENLN